MSTLFVPLDGRITSMPVLSGPLTGGEAMYAVSPGNATQGNSYQVTTAVLAAFMAAFPYLNEELITAGATIASPYNVEITDTRILFNKTLGSASYAIMPLAALMVYPFGVTFVDVKGDAGTNPITISFTNGELCNGAAEAIIDNNYGWVTVNPYPGGGQWFLTS
jgi:hypothetical protein